MKHYCHDVREAAAAPKEVWEALGEGAGWLKVKEKAAACGLVESSEERFRSQTNLAALVGSDQLNRTSASDALWTHEREDRHWLIPSLPWTVSLARW